MHVQRWILVKRLGLATLLGALFSSAGCASMVQASSSAALTYEHDAQPFFLDNVPRVIQRQDQDRYACATGEPLMCSCQGRFGGTCECSCPPN